VAASIANLAYEIVAGTSYALLGVQAFFFLALLALVILLNQGHKRKGLFFYLLLAIGAFAFYQAGSRMPDISRNDITLPPILTLCLGIGFVISAIYLSYSPEIDLYLKSRQQERDKLIQESY